jgi:hypothetical protein
VGKFNQLESDIYGLVLRKLSEYAGVGEIFNPVSFKTGVGMIYV